MQVPSRDDLAHSGTLEELYGKLDAVGIGPGWAKATPSLWPAPRKTFAPAHWSYEQARGALDAAGRLINTELAERRNLILFNPADGNSYGTVRTLVAAYQMIMPGEWARAHRHTPNALRLILDAEPGTYTEVDGVKIAMEPGDVLLTPNWSSHGHGNRQPRLRLLARFPRRAAGAAAWSRCSSSRPRRTRPHERASTSAPPTKDSPFVFPLSETLKRLDAAAPDPTGPFGTQVELGDPAIDTIGLYMMRLAPARQNRAVPHHREQHLRGRARAPARPRSTASASNGGAATSSRRPPGGRISTRPPGRDPAARHRRAGDAAARLLSCRGAETSGASIASLRCGGTWGGYGVQQSTVFEATKRFSRNSTA